MKRIFGLWPLVVLAVVLAGGYWYYQNQVVSATAVGNNRTQVVQVRRGTLSSTVSVVGQLEAEQSEALTFSRMSGTAKVTQVAVAAGNTVKKGQVLAAIDAAPYKQALEQAKSDLQAAEKKLAELQTPATALQLAQADLAIAKAEYQIQEAKNALHDLEQPDLVKLQSTVAQAENALAKARADLLSKQQDTAAKEELDKLREAEVTPTAEYNRLAAETHRDESWRDRVNVAYNKMMDAQDARVTAEIQREANLLSAQMTVRKAEQTLAEAQEALAQAQAGGDALALAKARLAVREAEVALVKAQEDKADLVAGADAVELAAAQADVDKKRLAVAEAEANLAGTQLAASFDGTVLKVNVKVGDAVTSSSQVVTVANLKALQVVALVDETTIKRVVVGQGAQITFDAYAGQTFRGKVLEVPLQGALQSGVMVYEVPVSLEGAERLSLLVGMTANVRIQVEQAQNALLVPSMALQRVGGRYQVLIPDPSGVEGAVVSVGVEVGLSDGTYTQITKGLNEGDRVVVQMAASTTNTTNRGNQPGGGVFIQGGPGGQPPPGMPGR